MREIKSCPICNSDSETILQFDCSGKDKKREYLGFLNSNKVVKKYMPILYFCIMKKCISCGHAYQKYVFNESQEKEFFENLYDKAHGYEDRKGIINKEISTISKICAYTSVLDVGSGFGDYCFLSNTDVYNIEPDKKARDFLIHMDQKVYPNIDKIDRKFNVIRVSHVLSHLHNNHKNFISKLLEMLENNGIIYFVEHDVDKVDMSPYFIKPLWHTNIFSKKSMKKLMEGFHFNRIKVPELGDYIFEAYRG